MDFDNAKENIQPLASGRNVHQLEVALNADAQTELHEQRQQFESNIQAYNGDDPLELWYEYILWLEQSYPKSGKDSAMDEVLVKCLMTFETDDKYKQDSRMIKLYIKYIDSQTNPQENYHILYNSGIGTKLADLYIGWAYYYDIVDNFEKVEDIFSKGKDAGAEPKDVLEQAHKNFGFSMSQRILKKMSRNDFLTTMAENRFALTSLQGHRKKNAIGSIRTGSVVKNFTPGTVQQKIEKLSTQQRSNVGIIVFNENDDPNAATDGAGAMQTDQTQQSASIITTIVNSSKRQENLREPGPWCNAQKDNKKMAKNLFKDCNQSVANFTILADEDNNDKNPINPYKIPLCDLSKPFDLSIKLPKNFVRKCMPQSEFSVPIFIEEEILPYRIPAYDKIGCCPRTNKFFSLEELAAYKWFKRNNIKNQFTDENDEYWCNGIEYPIRLPPLFCHSNDPQSILIYKEKPEPMPPKNSKFMFIWSKLYTDDCNEKSSLEECLREKYLNGELRSQLAKIESMDETIPVEGRKSMYCGAIRKSIVPGVSGSRKTILPPMNQSVFIQNVGDNDDDDNDLDEQSMSEDQPKPTVPLIFSNANGSSKLMPRKSILKPPRVTEQFTVFRTEENPPPTAASGAIPKIITTKRKSFENDMSDNHANSNKEISPTQRRKAIRQSEIQIESHSNAVCEKPTAIIINQPDVQVPSSSCQTNSVAQFEIFQDFDTAKDQQKQMIQPENQPEAVSSHFQIFQDPVPKAAQIAFKTPKAPITFPRKSVHQSASANNNWQLNADQDNDNNEENQFLPNDSFSTQNFNYFIKAQSISTPIAVKQRKAPLSIISPDKISPPPSASIPATAVQSIESHLMEIITPPSSTTVQPRQLSTIMETTETNTKSSVDTQLNSSPESDVCSSTTTSGTTQNYPKTPVHTKFSIFETKSIMNPLSNEPEKLPPTTFSDHKNDFEVPSTTLTGDNTSFNIFSDQIEQPIFVAPVIPPIVQKLNPIQIYVDKTEDIPKTALKSIPFDSTAKENIIIPSMVDKNEDETVPTLNPCQIIDEERTEVIPPIQIYRNETIPTVNLTNANTIYEDKTEAAIPNPMLINSQKPEVVNESIQQRSILPSLCSDTNDLEDLFAQTPDKLKTTFRSLRKYESEVPVPVSTGKFIRPPSKIPMRHYNQTPNISMREQSLHIKPEPIDFSLTPTPMTAIKNLSTRQQSFHIKSDPNVDVSSNTNTNTNQIIEQPQLMIDFESARHITRFEKSELLNNENDDNNEDDFIGDVELSIYVAKPSAANDNDDLDSWEEDLLSDGTSTENNQYLRREIDLNETNQIIDEHLNDPNINPWDKNLRELLLERIFFLNYLSNEVPMTKCNMLEHIGPIKLKTNLEFCNQTFMVNTLIGQGKFGRVYSAKNQSDNKTYALKQERPPNLWEYYICLEIVSRIKYENILQGLMTIPIALIGKNASILVSQYSPYGTLIDVCNKIKRSSGKNLNEFITMMFASQLLLIIDHLHAANIIHGDIKPDNILLMKKINSNNRSEIILQIIDFGEAIDMQLFPKNQKFLKKISTANFVCTEMLENRPWTFETDLFCLAGTIHTMLFGCYMQVIKKIHSSYLPKTSIPRYMDKILWETLFDSLINVRNNVMPNLQTLRDNLQKKIAAYDKRVREAVMDFNRIIDL